MAVIAMFYGIIVSMYYFDTRQHHRPHIHVKYQDEEVVLAIPDGEVLEGSLKANKRSLKANKMKLVQAWIEIHRDELMADWELASQGEQIFKIDPLKSLSQNPAEAAPTPPQPGVGARAAIFGIGSK